MTFSHSMTIRRHKSENRRQSRFPGNNAVIRASWIDIAGSLRMGQARLVDICERGLAMELPERPQPNTYVRFQCDKMKLNGTGAVRHCQAAGTRFVVGLEFSDGIRWKPPQTQADGAARIAPVNPQENGFELNWLFDLPAEPAVVAGSAPGNN